MPNIYYQDIFICQIYICEFQFKISILISWWLEILLGNSKVGHPIVKWIYEWKILRMSQKKCDKHLKSNKQEEWINKKYLKKLDCEFMPREICKY